MLFVSVSGLSAADPAPSREQLLGRYILASRLDTERLELLPSGRYIQSTRTDIDRDDVVSKGTWRLQKHQVVLHRQRGYTNLLVRFLVIARGTGWALVPKLFADMPDFPTEAYALQRE